MSLLLSTNQTHAIPFNFESKRFPSSPYPLNFENRINRQHFKSFLQNCSKIVRKCVRNVDASDRLMKYTAFIYAVIMVVVTIISIIAIILLSRYVNVIYPILVCVVVITVPTIGFGFTIYQRGKKIKEFHSNCQITLENYVLEENQKTIRIGIQWFAKYDSDFINLLSLKFAPTRYLTKLPRIEVSDRELQFSFEINPEEEEPINEEDDDNLVDNDNIRLINQDENEY
ncbi:predicted protein [Naegleria gruberi]|uniref:Predicted protein n=1 Tax=Naegleria gruberi TaxID=5762 RepID=D2VR32_NAEGR|nr:uncharacterized protein NAEGRDRAFT_71442 [Naegleria gruberi]EFC40821.1 predicted protein [Naegleria gruberi]|eukprot:XP_002673565.1 predicted protein [Naegleria gruberi strain NEG-M]